MPGPTEPVGVVAAVGGVAVVDKKYSYPPEGAVVEAVHPIEAVVEPIVPTARFVGSIQEGDKVTLISSSAK